MDYRGKVVLVSGGANGIGKAISHAYLTLGATVIIADIDEAAGGASMREWKQSAYKAAFYRIDLRDAAQISEMFAYIVAKHQQIDILINNAGKGIFKPLHELTVTEWDEVLNLNLRAAFIMAKEFAKYHKANGYGRIINIASTRCLMSEPHSEAYAASKGGVVALTHALALSLGAKNFTVNAISPGWIQTTSYDRLTDNDHRQHPARRVGRAEDISQACVFLTDEKNDFITGQNLVIDGGMTRKMIYVE